MRLCPGVRIGRPEGRPDVRKSHRNAVPKVACTGIFELALRQKCSYSTVMTKVSLPAVKLILRSGALLDLLLRPART
jgi:hypothetical protein